MGKQRIDIKPIMFRPTEEQDRIIKNLVGKKPLVDNKADAIKYLIDLGIIADKKNAKTN